MKGEWVGRWKGRTVVCIASGPSLTADDCERVRVAGHPAIVTNTTWRLAPWAEVLMAFDSKWWKHYMPEVAGFAGHCFTVSPARLPGVRTLHGEQWFKHFGNSGTAALSLAIVGGAAKVVLLGYDCQKTGGKTHWHGDHPKPLGNAKSIPRWPGQFGMVAKYAKREGVPVVNATRATALTCFPRVALEDAL